MWLQHTVSVISQTSLDLLHLSKRPLRNFPEHPWTTGVSQTPPCHSAAAHIEIRIFHGILSGTHASPTIVLFVLAVCYSMDGGIEHIVGTRH